MDLFDIIGLMALALAIFTIGLPYIPPNILYKMFVGKNPQTSRDIAVIKRFLGVLGAISYASFLVLLGILIAKLTEPFAVNIAGLFSSSQNVLKVVFQIVFGTIGVIVLILVIRFAWNQALRSVEAEEQQAEDKTEEHAPLTGSKSNSDDVIIANTADISHMDAQQLRAFTNCVNYLKTKGRNNAKETKGS